MKDGKQMCQVDGRCPHSGGIHLTKLLIIDTKYDTIYNYH